MKVIKKSGSITEFDPNKIIKAVNKSAKRVLVNFTETELNRICSNVERILKDLGIEEVEVSMLHNIVEKALEMENSEVAKSYKDYRNYKVDFVGMLDEVYKKAQKIMYLGDKDNSNTDSSLVSTKRSLIYNELNKELYNKFFLTSEEREACKEGYIYIHDTSSRRDTLNCTLFDVPAIMSGGFEMGNMWYNEPKTIDVACDVLGDIIMMSASMIYGGWSTRVDNLLAPYVEKTYNKYKQEIEELILKTKGTLSKKDLEEIATEKTMTDLMQGIQGLEYKLNSVASSRGDYPFTTFAIGLGTSKFEKMVSEAVLKVRMNGQGKKGKKRQVLFPKIIFLYDENLHGEGKELEDIFELGILCSSKSMYPDWLSLSGEGYVPSMYKQYGEVVYPMG